MNDQSAKINSGDKNSVPFLIKHLSVHFPDQTWGLTYKNLSESQPKKHIKWDQILIRVSKNGLNEGPKSNAWLTVLNLMEIAKCPENFLKKKDGSSVILWKKLTDSKDAYLKKCKNQISNDFINVVRDCIENSGLPNETKQIFKDTLPKERDNFSLIANIHNNAREDDRNHFYLKEDEMFHGKSSKKIKTETLSTYKSYKSLELIKDDQNENLMIDGETHLITNAKMKNIPEEEEKKHNYNINIGDNNQFQNHEIQKEIATADEKDKIIEKLQRQLGEKDNIINFLNWELEENNKTIAEQNQKIMSIIPGMNNLNVEDH